MAEAKVAHVPGPSFAVDTLDASIIREIAHRAVTVARHVGAPYTLTTATMDITACHANGTPLRLRELLDAPEFDFAHDVLGIRRHIDRTTGQLQDCFLPRFAKAEPANG